MQYSREEMLKSVPQTGFFGHPRGLGVQFFMEFWERFSYYGMRAILLYFLYDSVSHGGLGFDQTVAQSIMSLYGALIFMTCIVGGWVADRLVGSRTAMLMGAVLIMFGHIALSSPVGGRVTFLLSMFLIIIGTGLLKPNISAVVGGLYDKKDPAWIVVLLSSTWPLTWERLLRHLSSELYNHHLATTLVLVPQPLGCSLPSWFTWSSTRRALV